MIDPEYSGEHRSERNEGPHQAQKVVVGDEDIVPVLQPKVEQLEEEPAGRGPQKKQEETGSAAFNQRRSFGAADQHIHRVDQTDPGKQIELGGERFNSEKHERKTRAQPHDPNHDTDHVKTFPPE